MEWHRKFTIPFTCLLFFFIGAPLGSIVRKGGLGTPIVISVILFIIYYIVDNVGYKMTRDGVWVHWFGMWFSALILLPIGVFLTYKAMNDSVIMNADTYIQFIRRLFFIREKRTYPVKSVVIDKPDYNVIVDNLNEIEEITNHILEKYNGFSYRGYWNDEGYEQELRMLKSKMEITLNQVSNAHDLDILAKAEEFPVLISNVRLFKPGSLPARIAMYLFPVGILLRLVAYPFEMRIKNDLGNIAQRSGELAGIILKDHPAMNEKTAQNQFN